MTDFEIDPDAELFVWALTEAEARRFFGSPSDAVCRVVKQQPETPREKARYRADAKLFAVKSPDLPATPYAKIGQ